MSEEENLPKGWTVAKLGGVGTCVTGNTPPKSNPSNYGGTIPFVKPPQINNNIITDSSEYLSNEGGKKARILPIDSILVTCIGNLGRVGMNKVPIAFNQQINAIIPSGIYEPKLLFYQAQSLEFKTQLEYFSAATTVTIVNKGNFEKIRIPIPPLLEQIRILAKLEQLLTDLDKGIEYLKTAQQQLKVYRQAVLKWAFEGIKQFTSLNDIGRWMGGGTPSTQKKEYWKGGNVLWVSSQDVKSQYIDDTERKITELAIESSSTKWIKKGSLLFVVRSGILRRIFPIAIAQQDLCVNQDIQTLCLNDNYYTEFVYWYLLGNESDIRHKCAKDGTTVESIDVQKLKKYLIPITGLNEQLKIIQEIESRLSVCDKIEETIASSLQQAEVLRLSIIKKAFEGRLLSEAEINECRNDPGWEPAEKLLERIKLEKLEKGHSKKEKNKSGWKVKRIS